MPDNLGGHPAKTVLGPGLSPAEADVGLDLAPRRVDNGYVSTHSGRLSASSLISQTSEYSLRAVVYLAQRQDGPAAAQEIAAATRVPVGYLQKILRMLSRSGLLHVQRGAGGGFSLAKVPTAISVLDVLAATDTDISRIERCPLGLKGHISLCPLHRLIDEQIAGVRHAFASTSIADLLADETAPTPLCTGGAGRPATVGKSGRPRSD